jgi:hypothetical protein
MSWSLSDPYRHIARRGDKTESADVLLLIPGDREDRLGDLGIITKLVTVIRFDAILYISCMTPFSEAISPSSNSTSHFER